MQWYAASTEINVLSSACMGSMESSRRYIIKVMLTACCGQTDWHACMQWYIGPVMIIMTISSKVIANNILYGTWIWYTANTEKKHFHPHGLSGILKKDGMF